MRVVILPPLLCAPIGWYAAMVHADIAVIDALMRHDKRRKATHRFTIAGPRGPQQITVPIHRDGDVRTWADMTVSDHNHWWQQMAETLATAYGGTPYFDHIFPTLEPLLSSADAVGRPVTEYMLLVDAQLRRLTGITTPVSATMPLNLPADATITDLRSENFTDTAIPAYRQVRANSLGWLPGLSVLDALFNLGTTSTLQLLRNTCPPAN